MSLAIRSPRRSALDVTWCEDFSRGRLGVMKNQGVIHESSPDFVGFDGRWARFPGNDDSYINYPGYGLHGPDRTEITFGCRVKDVNVSTSAFFIGDHSPRSGEHGWILYYDHTNSKMYVLIFVSGFDFASVVIPASEMLEENTFVGRWQSGEKIYLYRNGIEVAESSAVVNGSIEIGDQFITIGTVPAGYPGYGMDGKLADPFMVYRRFTADEILAWHNGSLF